MLKDEYAISPLTNVRLGLALLPDIGERSGALKVNLGLWLVAGRLAGVRVGRHAVEADLVAPGHKVEEPHKRG